MERSRFRTAFIRGLWGLGALAGAVVMAGAGLWSFRADVVETLAPRIFAVQGLDPVRFTVEQLDDTTFILTDLDIGAGALAADRIELAFDPWAAEGPRIDRVALDRPRLSLIRDAAGFRVAGLEGWRGDDDGAADPPQKILADLIDQLPHGGIVVTDPDIVARIDGRETRIQWRRAEFNAEQGRLRARIDGAEVVSPWGRGVADLTGSVSGAGDFDLALSFLDGAGALDNYRVGLVTGGADVRGNLWRLESLRGTAHLFMDETAILDGVAPSGVLDGQFDADNWAVQFAVHDPVLNAGIHGTAAIADPAAADAAVDIDLGLVADDLHAVAGLVPVAGRWAGAADLRLRGRYPLAWLNGLIADGSSGLLGLPATDVSVAVRNLVIDANPEILKGSVAATLHGDSTSILLQTDQPLRLTARLADPPAPVSLVADIPAIRVRPDGTAAWHAAYQVGLDARQGQRASVRAKVVGTARIGVDGLLAADAVVDDLIATVKRQDFRADFTGGLPTVGYTAAGFDAAVVGQGTLAGAAVPARSVGFDINTRIAGAANAIRVQPAGCQTITVTAPAVPGLHLAAPLRACLEAGSKDLLRVPAEGPVTLDARLRLHAPENLTLTLDDGTALALNAGDLRLTVTARGQRDGSGGRYQAHLDGVNVIAEDAEIAIAGDEIQSSGHLVHRALATADLTVKGMTVSSRRAVALFTPLGIGGTAELKDGRMDFKAALDDPSAYLGVTVAGHHLLEAGTGRAQLELAPLFLDQDRVLARRLFPVLRGLVLIDKADLSGTVNAEWSDGAVKFDANAEVRDVVAQLSESLSAVPDGLRVTGDRLAFQAVGRWLGDKAEGAGTLDIVGTTLEALGATAESVNGSVEFDQLYPPATPPGQSLTVAVVDVGVPFSDGWADFQLFEDGRIRLENAAIGLFDGVVEAGDLMFAPGAAMPPVILTVEGVDFAQVLELAESQEITGTGILDGALPVVLAEGDLAVRGGLLKARDKGVFRYFPPQGTAESGATGFVAEALSDLRYDALSMTVDGIAGGELISKLRLKGHNPNFYGGHPVDLTFTLSGRLVEMMQKGLQGYGIGDDIVGQFKNPIFK